MYRFLLWLVPTVEKFPRSQKYLLGERIQILVVEVLKNVLRNGGRIKLH